VAQAAQAEDTTVTGQQTLSLLAKVAEVTGITAVVASAAAVAFLGAVVLYDRWRKRKRHDAP
jgi:hypothetical protein